MDWKEFLVLLHNISGCLVLSVTLVLYDFEHSISQLDLL